MKITSFARMVCANEAKRRQVNIAQVLEILKVTNKITNGELYKIIRKIMPKNGCKR